MTALLAAAAGALAGPLAVELLGQAAMRLPGVPAGKGLPVLALARGLAGHAPSDLAAKIDAARLPPAVDLRSVMGLKVALAATAASAAFIAASLAAGSGATLLLLVAPPAGFLLPDLLLARRGAQTRSLVSAEIPDVAARLHLAVSAGLPPVRAAHAAGSRGRGILSAELACAAGAAQAGLPFGTALERMVARCPAGDVRAIAAALARSQQQGTDISGLLDEIGRSSRRRESLRMRDRAQRAGPKIQLAVALLLVPAAMCLIASALLSGLFSA